MKWAATVVIVAMNIVPLLIHWAWSDDDLEATLENFHRFLWGEDD